MAISWMKKGQDSEKIAAQAEQEKQAQAEQKGRLWRFFLKEKEEAKITFVDGDLDAEGHLVPPRYYEHTIKYNGNWTNFVCPEKTVPEAGHHCPLCATGDRVSLVALFTVIDHRKVTTSSGKVITNQRKLFVAKTVTMEILTKIAIKRGGLAGATFDVQRLGDNSAAVGSMFDFTEKNTATQLQSAFVTEVEENGVKKLVSYFVPANYEEEIIFRTPEDMLKLGLGTKVVQGLVSGAGGPGGSSKPKANYGAEM